MRQPLIQGKASNSSVDQYIRDGNSSYQLIPQFVHHGIRVVFLGGDRTTISNDVLKRMEPTYPWDYEVRFLPDLKGIHFDTIVAWQRGPRWRGFDQPSEAFNFGFEVRLFTLENQTAVRARTKRNEVRRHLRNHHV